MFGGLPLAGMGVPGPPLCTFGLSLARIDREDGTREPTNLSLRKQHNATCHTAATNSPHRLITNSGTPGS